MIYLDVTAACLLPLESGIPRTTRGLWRLLQSGDHEIVPLVWQPFRACYTRLSPRAQKLLDGSFSAPPGERPPRDSTFSLLWASFCDLLSGAESVPLHHLLTKDDTLILTSIFPDNRLGYLQRIMERPGRKIAIFHDAIPLRDSNVARWERARHLETLRLLAHTDINIAVSHTAGKDLAALLVEHDLPCPPIEVLPWPVLFPEPRPSFSEPPDQPVRLLYVSRLKQTKNHDTLLAACEELWRKGANFELVLIGCQDEARESREILQRIAHLQERGRSISWRAQVSEADLHRAYREATFTVFPSMMEGFGLPIIESLWHGRPVICSAEGAIGELALQGGCVTANVRDAHALASAIQLLLQDRARRNSLARDAYDRPVRTWADYGRELFSLLENR